MITFICLLAIIGLGQCHQHATPTRSEIELSINRTIEEVERMVREDPSLPRLSRQQILDILHNITTEDLTKEQKKNDTDDARSTYQKALMVVLPYNAKDSAESLKDLYTKPPMVQIIPDSGDSGPIQAENVEVTSENPQEYDNTVATYTSAEVTMKMKEEPKQKYKNHRETYSEVHTSIPESLKTETAPMRFSFDLENLQKNAFASHRSSTVTRRPVYRRITTKKNEVTTPSDDSKKKNNGEITIDLRTTEYTTPASKTSQNVLSYDQWKYIAPPSTTSMPSTTAKTTEGPMEKITEEPTIVTTIRVVVGDVATKKHSESNNLQDENIEINSNSPVTGTEAMLVDSTETEMTGENSRPVYVTPMSTMTSQKPKYSSTYSFNAGGFLASTTSTKAPMRQEVEELLASIGLRPNINDNIEDIYKKNNEIFDSKYQVQDANSIISGLTTEGLQTPSTSTQNTFKNAGSDIRKGMDNLPLDVQLLFQRFGLQTSQQHEKSVSATTTTKAPVNFNSYTNFKPLPTSRVKDQEMKDFLAQFGLGINENRAQKAMRASTERPSLIEAVPQNMKKILQNIGLISRVPDITTPSGIRSTTSVNKIHVFKPHEALVKDEKQKMKISELLDTVKMVQEGRADVKDVQKIADDLLKNTKTLTNGPDPLSLEEIFKLYSADLKNEVKRQQNETDSTQLDDQQAENSSNAESETTLMAVATTESTTLATDSAKSASDQVDSSTSSSNLLDSLTSSATTESVNLDALAESFGGSTAAPDPALPPKRRNGFYFLVDWNTFLEVGEEDKDKVNIRFQPKVGDRSRFIPVTVP